MFTGLRLERRGRWSRGQLQGSQCRAGRSQGFSAPDTGEAHWLAAQTQTQALKRRRRSKTKKMKGVRTMNQAHQAGSLNLQPRAEIQQAVQADQIWNHSSLDRTKWRTLLTKNKVS